MAVAAAPAAMGCAARAAAAVSTAMSASVAATFRGEPQAGTSGVFFVKDIKSCQADVGDFLISEHDRCSLLRRYAVIRSS